LASVCLTVLVTGGFLAILIIFHIASIETTAVSNQQVDPDGYSYTFAQNEMILVAQQNSTLLVSLLNGDLH
jgi:hypothetical protein